MPLRVTVDRNLCIGCGVAPTVCKEVFVLEDGKNRVKDEFSIHLADSESVGVVPDDLRRCVEDAAYACPVDAIEVKVVKG